MEGGLPQIRLATPADRAPLLALWLELIDYHRGLDPPLTLPDDLPGGGPLGPLRESLRDEIERGVRSPDCRVLVADLPSGAQGAVAFLFAELALRESEAHGRIEELYVAPEWRRRGLGKSLVSRADGWFRERGVRRVSIRLEPGNTTGRRFWQALGFVECAHILETRLVG